MKDGFRVLFKEISAGEGEAPPSDIILFPAGDLEMEGLGTALVDEEAAQTVIEEYERRGLDIVIDYEHQSLKDVQAPAAGWIKKLYWKAGEGLRAVVEWTERAQRYLKAKEYRYFSPVVLINAADRRPSRLYSVALTNTPKTNHLPAIVAKMERDEPIKKEEERMIAKLKQILGLAADAAEDKVTEAVEAIVAKLKNPDPQPVACKEVLEAIGARDGAGKDEVLRMVASLKAPGDVAVSLSHEVAELKRKLTLREQEDLVTLALKEGKTSPEELDKWGKKLALDNPEQFRLIVLSRPAGSVIPVDGIRIAKGSPDGGMDEAQRTINEMCGVADETFKKYSRL